MTPSITKARCLWIMADLQHRKGGLISSKILNLRDKNVFNWSVAYRPARLGLRRKCFENSCVLCSAVAYCCGAVAPCAIAALLGRFLPRLGPLVHSSGPFFFWGVSLSIVIPGREANPESRDSGSPLRDVRNDRGNAYSAAAWNGPRSLSGTCASASASVVKSAATCAKRRERSRRRSSI